MHACLLVLLVYYRTEVYYITEYSTLTLISMCFSDNNIDARGLAEDRSPDAYTLLYGKSVISSAQL